MQTRETFKFNNYRAKAHVGQLHKKTKRGEEEEKGPDRNLPPVPSFPSFPPFEQFVTADCDLPGASSAVHVSVAAPAAYDDDTDWYNNAVTSGIPRLPQYPRSVWRAEKHREKLTDGMRTCHNPFLDTVESFHEHPFSLPREWTHTQVDCAVARAVGKAERERSEKAQAALAK